MAPPPDQRPTRAAGVLLHPTSLPGPYGVGDLGPAAYAWVDALARARQNWWQILPLTPTGYGDSPYQAFSAFAGNPYLVSPEFLVRDGLVAEADLAGRQFPADRVDYGAVIDFKTRLLGHAWEQFRAGRAPALRPRFDEFCSQHAGWLDDYALFRALKDAHGGRSWNDWPRPLVFRDPAALQQARHNLAEAVGRHQFGQLLFFRQWHDLQRYAHAQGVRFIGDVPIFVSSDSADVWANPEIFLLDAQRRPRVVAGVPPDYFSQTGQLWGNPLYDWEALARTGYRWWVERLRATLAKVDVIRLDHFRGFEAYWEVPAGMPTAQTGRWVQGPGARLFERLREALGGLPFIAEDLGLITPEVEALRRRFDLPGMSVLQFAFGGGADNPYLPHNYGSDTVAYTGTHDNDTTRGWYAGLPEKEAAFVRRYLGRDGSDVAWDLVRLAWGSVARYAVVPLQDLLDLGSEGRMNMPGRPFGNWAWRFEGSRLTPATLDRLAELTELYARAPARPAA